MVHNQILKRAQTSNGTLKINTRDVKQIVLPVPPKAQQIRLLRQMGGHDDLIQALMIRVDTMERLKRGLIQALLTGKVRVPVKSEVAET